MSHGAEKGNIAKDAFIDSPNRRAVLQLVGGMQTSVMAVVKKGKKQEETWNFRNV